MFLYVSVHIQQFQIFDLATALQIKWRENFYILRAITIFVTVISLLVS